MIWRPCSYLFDYVTVHSSFDLFSLCVTDIVSSKQATLRHTKVSTYRCFLPDLTRFMDFRCARPICQHHLHRADQNKKSLSLSKHPAIADCRLQGAANSPWVRYWRRARDLNPRNAFDVYTISSRAPSTTRPALHKYSTIIKESVQNVKRN